MIKTVSLIRYYVVIFCYLMKPENSTPEDARLEGIYF